MPALQARNAMLLAYLSPAHMEEIKTACLHVALSSETARHSKHVRRLASIRMKELTDLFTKLCSETNQIGGHRQALVTIALMVGAITLTRAVDDRALASQLREAALEHRNASPGSCREFVRHCWLA